MKAFKAFIKPFEALRRIVKIKIEVNFSFTSGIVTGSINIEWDWEWELPTGYQVLLTHWFKVSAKNTGATSVGVYVILKAAPGGVL